MTIESVERARSFRRDSRWAEKLLWRHLRNRKTAGLKFRRQHPAGPYVLDFFCPEKRLAVELDGEEHGLPERQERDGKRDEYLRSTGIRVLRFWNFQLRENLDGVLEKIRMVAAEDPHPGPLPGGEGGETLTPTLSRGGEGGDGKGR